MDRYIHIRKKQQQQKEEKRREKRNLTPCLIRSPIPPRLVAGPPPPFLQPHFGQVRVVLGVRLNVQVVGTSPRLAAGREGRVPVGDLDL